MFSFERLGGGTGRRTGLKTLHRLLFCLPETERDIAETLVWSGFQCSRATTHYNLLQLVFGQLWKKKWQKSAKWRSRSRTTDLETPLSWTANLPDILM
jgi:hypothetical protein